LCKFWWKETHVIFKLLWEESDALKQTNRTRRIAYIACPYSVIQFKTICRASTQTHTHTHIQGAPPPPLIGWPFPSTSPPEFADIHMYLHMLVDEYIHLFLIYGFPLWFSALECEGCMSLRNADIHPTTHTVTFPKAWIVNLHAFSH
jgi:hypothetical protein